MSAKTFLKLNVFMVVFAKISVCGFEFVFGVDNKSIDNKVMDKFFMTPITKTYLFFALFFFYFWSVLNYLFMLLIASEYEKKKDDESKQVEDDEDFILSIKNCSIGHKDSMNVY